MVRRARGPLTGALVALGMAWGLASCGPPAAAPGPVTCYCFLNTHPCESSRRLEEWTKTTLEDAFQGPLRSGQLVFRTLNYEQPGQEHYLKDYDLPFQSIVLQEAPPRARWLRLDGLWRYLGDEAAFRRLVREETAKYLAGECRPNGE